MVTVPEAAATVVHCVRFPRGSFHLTPLSYQQLTCADIQVVPEPTCHW
jgi:hypothetical protein